MVIHGKLLFVNYLFVKQFTYYSFLLNLQSKQATTMKIRLEQPSDYRKVENLTREAFWNVYRPGCYEHFVLNQFRNNPDFIPELDLVMEEDGMIIGHIMFSKAELILDDGTRCPSWTFGPISIHPDYQRKEYGLKLLNYALDKARKMGVGFLCMEGNIDFYKHAGFVLASTMGIHYHAEPRDAEVPYFLAQELISGWLKSNGLTGATYCPPKGYFVAETNPNAFASFEATFPAKEKTMHLGQLPQFCQSCGMPLTKNDDCGTNADGSTCFDYCKYCYQDGKFLQNCTMDEMIEHCAKFVGEVNKGLPQPITKEEYIGQMKMYFPHLKRWRNEITINEAITNNPVLAGVKDLIAKMADTLPVTYISSVDKEGFPCTKAMLSPRVREGIKTFYFTTNTFSLRVAHYKANPKASIYFCDAEGFKGMMLRGTMEVLTDAASKEMVWREGDTEYYPGGITDPNYCVLKFTAIDGRFYSDFYPRSFIIEE